jgi:hypothetical protein
VSPLCDARLARPRRAAPVGVVGFLRLHTNMATGPPGSGPPRPYLYDTHASTRRHRRPDHPTPLIQTDIRTRISPLARSGAPPIRRSSPPPSPVAMDEAKGTALSMLALLVARDRFAKFCDPRFAPANSAPDRVDLVLPCRTRLEIRRFWGALRELGSCFVREWVWGWESVRIRR